MEAVAEQLASWDVLAGLDEIHCAYAGTMNTAVLQRCRHFLDASGASAGLLDELDKLSDAVEGSSWTTPDLAYAYHVGLCDEAVVDAAYLPHVVDRLAELRASSPPPVRCGTTEADRYWTRCALQLIGGDDDQGTSVAFEHSTDRDEANLNAATAYLQRAWPEMAGLVRGLVREVVWWRSARDVDVRGGSATLAQTFGAVFLAQGGNVVELTESLVHETTHLDMIMRTAIDKLILNREVRAKSPFRAQDRPLLRVLHAAVVSARIWVALDRCTDEFESANRVVCLAHRDRAARDLDEALRGLNTAVECTETGTRLLASLNELSRRASAEQHAVSTSAS